jgi:hypothetical protein
MHVIRNFLAITALFVCLSSCKKTIENIQEDLVIKAMTDGKWGVTNFARNGVDITGDFAGYEFKYYDNPKKVDAIKNGNVEMTGTWNGDASTMTTWASFPGASHPLSLINGSWHIDRSGWTYVEATQTDGSETKTMRLDKQ